ncbi:hypothetical protein [Salimicrobium halophilum]|uniref:Uncharacterized protein n=1 Tax=Salimicrobium halophilum TaxID=86666 RepID=A0A1G8T671_9BACI|nr:hypothetical protein [Salimicrobium halophilum]SDJ36485.1 hypothetical protein SAMN04490247_1705 [Salimicrobium halophilum]
MKKEFLFVLLTFVLLSLSGFHSTIDSHGAVLKAQENVITSPVEAEEEPSGLAGTELFLLFSALFLIVRTIFVAILVITRRLSHLTTVFYEGGYLPVFHKCA